MLKSSFSRILLVLVTLALPPAEARITAPGTTDADIWCVGPSAKENCVDKNGNFLNTTDNLGTLGTSALRWEHAYLGTSGVTFGDGSNQTTAAGSGVWGVNGSKIYYTGGNVGVGIASAAATLDVEGNAQFGSTAKSTFSANGSLTLAPNTNVTVSGPSGYIIGGSSIITSGSFFGDGSHLTGISGSLSGGTIGAIPKWATASTLSSSLLTESASSNTFAGALKVNGGIDPSSINLSTVTTALSQKVGLTELSTVTLQGNAFSVGGSTFVVTGGYVGIGTVNPAGKLHVSTGPATSNLVVGVNGLVGVGTANPLAPISIQGETAYGQIVMSTGAYGTAGTNAGYLGMAANGVLITGAPNGSFQMTSEGGLSFSGNGGSSLNMFIDTSGHVGIGNTNPGATLDITGTFRVSGDTLTVSAAGVSIKGHTDGSSPCTGCIGELKEANSVARSLAPSATVISVSTLTLTAGYWIVEQFPVLCSGTGGDIVKYGCYVSLNNDGIDGAATDHGAGLELTSPLVGNVCNYLGSSKRKINVTTSTPVYMSCKATYTTLGGATWDSAGYFKATRIW